MTRVLVVEDYPPLATVVAIALRRSTGHEVVRVGSVQRAVAAISEHPAFDVVVMDIDLPDGSGVELARQLIGEGKARTCVFFTASRDDKLRKDARALGPVVDKLAPMSELVRVVLENLGAAHAPVIAEVVNGGPQAEPGVHSSGTRRRSGR
ncbi:MAG: response regulator [Polyangiaceae bacterium]